MNICVSAEYPLDIVLQALSFIETGTKVAPSKPCRGDSKIGKDGEVSRYQMLQHVWQDWAKGTKLLPTKPIDSRFVAELELTKRLTKFKQLRGRNPTLREIYVLWNSPAKAYSGRLPSRRVETLTVKFESEVHRLTSTLTNYDTTSK